MFEKNEGKQKEAGVGPIFFKKTTTNELYNYYLANPSRGIRFGYPKHDTFENDSKPKMFREKIVSY